MSAVTWNINLPPKSFKSSPVPFSTLWNLTSTIFNSNINDISYIIDKDRIHIAKLLKINIKDKLNETNNKIALNDEIRKAVYFELLKNVNISTNDQLIEAILNNY